MFIAGMPKCGSYFLYDLLGQHPQINMHSGKEPSYFQGKLSEQEYLAGFRQGDFSYYGDGSVGQMTDSAALKKIKQQTVDPKFIVLARQPVKRAISHYYHRVNVGLETRSLDKVLQNPDDSECYPVFYSRYRKHLEHLFKVFPPEKVKLIIAEDLYAQPRKVYMDLLEFLQLSPYEPHPEQATTNQGRVPKSRKLAYWSKKLSQKKTLKKSFSLLLPLLRRLRRNLEKLNSRNVKATETVNREQLKLLEKELQPEIDYMRRILHRPNLWEN